MLLNEFLKEHRRVEELRSAMAQQRKDFEVAIVQQQKTTEALVARLNAQEARIQKVSAQVEMRKSGSQMVVENQ
jgi:anion-transporting  ArsA/GET3 family ATPase